MKNSLGWSSLSSIPSTARELPESAQKGEEHYGNVVVQNHGKKIVTILIPKKDFTISLPSVCRQIEWNFCEAHTELTFFVHSYEYDEHVPPIAQMIQVLTS